MIRVPTGEYMNRKQLQQEERDNVESVLLQLVCRDTSRGKALCHTTGLWQGATCSFSVVPRRETGRIRLSKTQSAADNMSLSEGELSPGTWHSKSTHIASHASACHLHRRTQPQFRRSKFGVVAEAGATAAVAVLCICTRGLTAML